MEVTGELHPRYNRVCERSDARRIARTVGWASAHHKLRNGGLKPTLRGWEVLAWMVELPFVGGRAGLVFWVCALTLGFLSRGYAGSDPQVVFEGRVFPVGPAKFSPDGRLLIVNTGYADTEIWNLDNLTLLNRLMKSSATAFSSNSRLVGVGFPSGGFMVWEPGQTMPMHSIYPPEVYPPLHDTRVYGVAFSPDGKRIAVKRETLFLYSVENGQLISTMAGGSSQMGFLPDGVCLFYALTRGFFVLNTESKELAFSQEGSQYNASLTRDERILVSSSGAEETRILDPEQDYQEVMYPSTVGQSGFRLAPYDDKLIQVHRSGNDVLIKRWAPSGAIEAEATFSWEYPSPAHSAFVSPDSRKMVTLTSDGCYLWNISEIATPVHEAMLHSP